MCSICMATKKRKKRSSITISNTAVRFGAAGAGMVAAKLSNAPIKKIPVIGNYLSNGSKVAQGLLAGAKMGLGYLGYSKSKNQYIKDMSVGFGAVGAIEAVGIFVPQASLCGLDYQDDVELLGTTVDIDLDNLAGSSFDNDLESHQEVAGHELDDYLEEGQMIAGDMYVEEDYA